MRRAWALAASVALVLLDGCGGTSKDAFIRTADGVCAEANRQLMAAGPLPRIDVTFVTASQLPAVAAYLDRVLPILRSESARLHALGDPDEDGATVDDIRSFFDGFVSRLEETARDAHAGDAHTVTPALDKGLANGYQAQTIAAGYGFTVCGKLPALNGP